MTHERDVTLSCIFSQNHDNPTAAQRYRRPDLQPRTAERIEKFGGGIRSQVNVKDYVADCPWLSDSYFQMIGYGRRLGI